jgi:hypothetical protein
VHLAPERLGSADPGSTEQRLGSLALDTKTDNRGFFQLEGVAPGTYVVTATAPGMAPARVSPVIVREGLEAEIIEPLILSPPVTLRVELSPPVDPYGGHWSLRLLQETNAGGPLGTAAQGQADGEGHWVQGGLTPGKYQLQVLGDLGSRWVDHEIEIAAGEGPIPIDIPVIEIGGHLTIGDSPLSGTLWFGGSHGVPRVRFDADERGVFEGFLPNEGTWPVDLVSESEGLELGLEPVEVHVRSGKRAAEVEIRIPDTTLEGAVVDESGQGVPGASIEFTGDHKLSEIKAGKEGKFRIRGLAPPYVFIEAEDGTRSTGPVEAALVEGEKSPWLRLVLQDRIEVRGQVVSPAGPVPGAEVLAWPGMDQVAFASDDRTVTGPEGTFSLHFPSATRSLTLFVSAPGYAFHMARVVVQKDRLLVVPVESPGGTLILDLPRAKDGGAPPSPLLVHGGTFTPLLLLSRWASLQRAEQSDPGRLVVPNVESGDYGLCVNAGADLRQGKEPLAGRCARGSIVPNGELTLSLPSDS